jgi:anti-sigma B factor antagonist
MMRWLLRGDDSMSDENRSDPLLQVSVQHWNGNARVRLGGELDLSSQPNFERALTAAEAYATKSLFLELDNLVFMDSTGLSVLLGALKRAQDAGREFRVSGARDEVRHLLAISGLHWLLEAQSGAEESPDGTVEWVRIPVPEGSPDG